LQRAQARAALTARQVPRLRAQLPPQDKPRFLPQVFARYPASCRSSNRRDSDRDEKAGAYARWRQGRGKRPR